MESKVLQKDHRLHGGLGLNVFYLQTADTSRWILGLPVISAGERQCFSHLPEDSPLNLDRKVKFWLSEPMSTPEFLSNSVLI